MIMNMIDSEIISIRYLYTKLKNRGIFLVFSLLKKKSFYNWDWVWLKKKNYYFALKNRLVVHLPIYVQSLKRKILFRLFCLHQIITHGWVWNIFIRRKVLFSLNENNFNKLFSETLLRSSVYLYNSIHMKIKLIGEIC